MNRYAFSSTIFVSLLGFAPANALPILAPSAVGTVGEPVAAACHFHDGAFTGKSADAYYGNVQVVANIMSGCLASVDVLDSPSHRNTSRRINAEALPILQSEEIRAQGGRVDIVSGATLTSQAYVASLKDALKQASQ